MDIFGWQLVFPTRFCACLQSKYNSSTVKSHFPDFILTFGWRPSSPYLNLLDFFLLGILEARVNAITHTSIESLKETLLTEWNNLFKDDVRASIDAYSKVFRQIIKAKRGRIEKNLLYLNTLRLGYGI